MLKIHNHIQEADPTAYLNSQAEALWNHLNPKTKRDEWYQNSLIKRVERKQLEVEQKSYQTTYCNNDEATIDRHKSFYRYLTQNDFENLHRLIVSLPDALEAIRTEVNGTLFVADYYDTVGKSQTAFGKMLLDEIFTYKNYRKSAFCAQSIKDIGMQHVTCPYCNYIIIDVTDISREDDERTILRAYLDIDHFMPKSQNPFFAISYFNLIPSCHSCNSTEKGDQEFLPSTHVNPFNKNFNELYVFVLNEENAAGGDAPPDIQLTLNDGMTDSIADDLKLNVRFRNGAYSEAIEKVNYYRDYQGDANDPKYSGVFRAGVLQGIAESSSKILRHPRGKMTRDILIPLDTHGILAV